MAGADTNFTPELKQFTSGLMAKGVTQVGLLDLQDFNSELDKIEWHVTDQPFAQPAVDSPGVVMSIGANGALVATQGVRIPEKDRPYRASARCFENEVYIGAALANAKPSMARTQTLFHEAFCSLGYNDNHSAQSSSILLIDQYPNLAKPLGDSFFNSKSLYDGGSSVGGGGDFDSMDLKQKVLDDIFSRYKSVTADFLSNYAGITVEPMDEDDNQRVMIMYKFNRKGLVGKPKFRGVRQDRKYEELITVLFPRKSWKSASAKDKSLIVQLISYGITSVFPTSPAQTEVDPSYTTCKGKPLMIPKERSSNASLVLRFRSYMVSNCRPRIYGRSNGMGFEADMPRAALR